MHLKRQGKGKVYDEVKRKSNCFNLKGEMPMLIVIINKLMNTHPRPASRQTQGSVPWRGVS